jgi:hypothetical protein
MRNVLTKSPYILFFISIILALISSFYLWNKITPYSFVAASFSYFWFIQLAIIHLLGFESKARKTLSWTSLFLSFTTFINLNNNWLITLWKYELLFILGIILGYWLLKFKSQIKVYYFIFLCLATVFTLIYIGLLILYNQFNSSYFTSAYVILSSLILLYFITGIQRLFKKVP